MSSYQEQLNFKREKLLLRLKQTDNIKKEILKHINKNNKQFMKFMEDIIYLDYSNDLYDLENQYKNLDIIDCQMSILDDEAGDITKMVAFSKYFQSLEDIDREDIFKAL
jgi:hypothetical protein